jgi:hypothetical protein
MDDAVSSELDGDVTWTSAVFGDSLETLAQATAPRAPTKRTVVMMPMSLRFMVASFWRSVFCPHQHPTRRIKSASGLVQGHLNSAAG